MFPSVIFFITENSEITFTYFLKQIVALITI